MGLLSDMALTAPGIHLLLTSCDSSTLPEALPPAASIHSREKGRDGAWGWGAGRELPLPLSAKRHERNLWEYQHAVAPLNLTWSVL